MKSSANHSTKRDDDGEKSNMKLLPNPGTRIRDNLHTRSRSSLSSLQVRSGPSGRNIISLRWGFPLMKTIIHHGTAMGEAPEADPIQPRTPWSRGVLLLSWQQGTQDCPLQKSPMVLRRTCLLRLHHQRVHSYPRSNLLIRAVQRSTTYPTTTCITQYIRLSDLVPLIKTVDYLLRWLLPYFN